ncbi:MAG: S41 family peptidase [Crocinitomicaceae bacterium]|nr:S41 family peptidase [Crocinitomicaceae bacterium]
MKSLLYFILTVFTVVALTSAATFTSIHKQLRDYTVFNTVLSQKEGRLDLHTDLANIESHFSNLRSELQTEKSLLEQYKLYSSALSKIECGHTQVHINKPILREWLMERNSLPIDYYLIGKRLVVNKLVSNDAAIVNGGKSSDQRSRKIKAGSEIISIDHKTVSEMMEGIGKYISSDENSMDFKYFQAAQMFAFFRHLDSPFTEDSIHVRYVDGVDTNQVYLFTGTAPVNSMNHRLRKNAQSYTDNEFNMGQFKIVKSEYAYFRFKSFSTSSGKNYEAFLLKSFKKIKTKHIDKLVVDLRGNTGGVMQYSFMKYLVGPDVVLGRYVVEKPKTRINSKLVQKMNIHFLRHSLMSQQQERKKRRGLFDNGTIRTEDVDTNYLYDGQIVVITDEGTFSSAAILACHLKTLSNAKIVGRTPGGSFYAGNAGTLIVKLPQSGIKLSVNPNTFYSHLEMTDNPTEIKQPDLDLNPLIIDKKKTRINITLSKR